MYEFMMAEMTKIDKDKWYKGQELSKDPGQEFILNWISEHGREFRELWNASLCKNCSRCECRYNVTSSCAGYVPVQDQNN